MNYQGLLPYNNYQHLYLLRHSYYNPQLNNERNHNMIDNSFESRYPFVYNGGIIHNSHLIYYNLYYLQMSVLLQYIQCIH